MNINLKRFLLALTLTGITVWNSMAQTKSKFFNDKDLMEFGTYYYPEQWPKEQWSRDIKRISDLGFQFTHFGEFAWSAMEPEDGKFDFTWLDEALKLAEANNLKVVMCTPTPAPPAWLSRKYPEILMVTEDGRRVDHGGRQQASWSSEVYKKYVDRIVTKLAERYGNNKTISGWQIDNEPSHYSNSYDHNEAAQLNFRAWLLNKYKNIAALNAAWGAAFWSQTYNNFDQINTPNSKLIGRPANPHAVLDFKRFTADEAASFIMRQQAILRKNINANQWITTNVMTEHAPVDPWRMKGLDLMTYTKYLVAGFTSGTGDQGFRIGSATSIGFANDFNREITGNIGVMELQPGQVNWGKYTPQTLPGAVRLWIYHVFAGGNRFVCNYRFRQPLSGIEQYHYGIMKTDGVSVSRTGEEFVTAIKEIEQLKKTYKQGTPEPSEYKARRTAILFNPDNRWETDHQPQTAQWNFMTHMMKYYAALKSMGAPVNFIDEQTDFSTYPVMIAPAYQLLDKPLVDRWKQYVQQGGHLILTTRTGQKNRDAHFWETRLAEPIYDLIGAKEIYFDHLPEEKMGQVNVNDSVFKWNNWADVLLGVKDTDRVAVYNDQFFKGETAVTHRKLGKGTITYIGADTDDGLLESNMLRKVYSNAKIPVLNLPKGVIVEWRDGYWVALNYSSTDQNIEISEKAKILIGARKLPPAGVVVWQ